MSSERTLPLSHASRKSGSENRRQQRIIGVRVTQETYDKISRAAESERLTVPSYVREFLIQAPGIRSRRRPLADVAALAALTAELNRIGGNINQIARAINQGDTPEGAWLRDALVCLLDTMKRVRGAMGFEA